MIRLLPALTALFLALPPRPADAEAFPSQDFEDRARAVSDGELRFLTTAPNKPVHHHSNRIRILPSSLESGWVELAQCHEHLDPVPATEIVFHSDRIRDIRILSHSGIGDVRIDAATVELTDIGPGARLCLSARSQALLGGEGGAYILRNGPFMRRFLDGYYPMRVSLDIRYPQDSLQPTDTDPEPQVGFTPHHSTGRIRVDTWFEGRLVTRFGFCQKGHYGCPMR